MISATQLSPKNQNAAQKAGLFLSVFLVLLIVLFHYPFGGYYYHRGDVEQCTQRFTEEIKPGATFEQWTKGLEIVAKCEKTVKSDWLPFDEWSSSQPLVDWFGSVVHTLVALLFIVVLCFAWLTIFQSQQDRRS